MEIDDEAETNKYYDIILLIRHPTIDPAVITETLGLEPYASQKFGEERYTPKGTRLAGTWSKSAWNHVFEFRNGEILSDELDLMLDWLSPHKNFFHQIVAEKGSVSLFINLPGSVNHGVMFEPLVLQKIIDMKMSFGFEIFPDWHLDKD